ncbi:MAG TPA: discoidin domain-containing protein [Polyangiales bacterium]|nr:discoidin domain-containing protein [Polyangiales bacterium]
MNYSAGPLRARLIILCSMFLLATSQLHAQGAPANLLLDRAPLRERGVLRASGLSDGKIVRDGDSWKTRMSAMFADCDAYAVFDLASPQPIAGVWLQGDNDDTYRIEISLDDKTYERLWDAPSVRHAGMQPRTQRGLHATARFIRIRPLNGDGNFAITELQLSSDPQAELPVAQLTAARSLDQRMRDHIVLFGLAFVCLLLLPARAGRVLQLIAAVVAGAGLWQLGRGVWDAWPVDQQALSLLRGTLAFIGAVAVARAAFAPARLPASRPVVLAVLGLCAGLAFASFYNLGHPQFYNAQRGHWTFAHYLDLRQYYPTAKYFREIGYADIYDADLAAYHQDLPLQAAKLDHEQVRDLRTLETMPAHERREQGAAIVQRFSPERWDAYRRDAAWFRDAMGDPTYRGSLVDFGGNATPFWMAIAHVLFSLVPPSDAAFTWLGMIDLVLLGAMFAAIARCFGARAMLMCLLVFGANDFVMYGTNWSGATLRHDWLAYLGFGACLLKREHYRSAGALLALAALIRAFPALALVGVGLPSLWRVLERVWRARSWRELVPAVRAEQVLLRVAFGAAVALAVGLVFAQITLGSGAWSAWLGKVAELESAPHPACVALRNLIAGWTDQAHILGARWPLYVAIVGSFCAVVGLVARNLPPERAAILALFLVPVVFYPANYYLHIVFLFPLLAPEPRAQTDRDGALLWITLLLMCAGQYFTTLESDLTLHFYYSTVSLFAALTVMSIVLLRADPSVHAWLAAPPARGR